MVVNIIEFNIFLCPVIKGPPRVLDVRNGEIEKRKGHLLGNTRPPTLSHEHNKYTCIPRKGMSPKNASIAHRIEGIQSGTIDGSLDLCPR